MAQGNAPSPRPRRGKAPLRVALVLAALAGACAAASPREGLEDRLPPLAWPMDLTPSGRPWIPLRTAIHVHTEASHDATGSVAEIASAAAAVGVDVVVITDHRNRDQASHEGWHGPVLVIVGQELAGGAHVLAVGQDEAITPTPGEARPSLIARAQAADAFTVAAHPTRKPRADTPDAVAHAAAVEVYSMSTDTLGRSVWDLVTGALRLQWGSVRPVLEEVVAPPHAALRLWDEQLASRPCVGVCAADSHGTYGLTHAMSLRTAQTHVLVRERTREAVLEALRAGRCYGTLELWAPVPYFWFEVAWPGGAAPMGATRPWTAGAAARVRLPAPATIRLLRDGARLHEAAKADRLDVELPGPGVYRVEAWLGERLWIFSNAVRLVSPSTG